MFVLELLYLVYLCAFTVVTCVYIVFEYRLNVNYILDDAFSYHIYIITATKKQVLRLFNQQNQQSALCLRPVVIIGNVYIPLALSIMICVFFFYS